MTEALNLFVRRASDQGPIELVINKAGITEIVIVNIGQAKNLLRDLLPMVLGNGSISSPSPTKLSGKPSAGELVHYRTITVNSRSSENGQARATR